MAFRTLLRLSFLVALAGALRADWRVTTVSTYEDAHNHSRWVDTEYYKNGMQRSDHIGSDKDKPRYVTVMDSPGTRWTQWDLERREYSTQTFRPTLPAHGASAPDAGPAIIIDVENSETGERRKVFGRVARRMVTLERRHAAGGALETESRSDGWYIDSKTMPEQIRHAGNSMLLLSSGPGHSSIHVNRHGVGSTGFAVSLKRTDVWISPTGERVTSQTTSEVTELFEGPLDADLFQPPAGFRRAFHNCLAISWRDKLDCFEDWASALVP